MSDQVGRENFTSTQANVTTAITNSTGGISAYQYQWGTGATFGEVVHYYVPSGSHNWYDGTVANGYGFVSGSTMFAFLQKWTLFNA